MGDLRFSKILYLDRSNQLFMPEQYTQGQSFQNTDYTINELPQGEYEQCTFRNCNLKDGNLSGFLFIDCTFQGCDLSMAKINKTSFRDVKFIDCKMLGLRFDSCNSMLISFTFERCVLNFSSFFKLKLKNIRLKECQLHEVEFQEADFTKAEFVECDLTDAFFENTNLEQADFSTAHSFIIDPQKNRLKKTRFSTNGLAGLLTQYDLVII